MANTLEDFVKQLSAYVGAPSIGAKYWETRDLSLVQIAALIRADIKQDIANAALPRGKYFVRTRKYAGGGSIDITAQIAKSEPRDPVSTKLTLQYLLDQYNYDASHGMHDYSCNRFFGHITVT